MTNPGGRRAVICVNGGTAREAEGTWSATLEWLVRRLAPDFPELSVRRGALPDQVVEAAHVVHRRLPRRALARGRRRRRRELALLGFSMGGAVAIAAADHARVTTVIGLGRDQCRPARRLDARRPPARDRPRRARPLAARDPGRQPEELAARLRAHPPARSRPRAPMETSGGLHGLAVRGRRGGAIPLPRARRWARLVAAELRRFESPAL